ncbi:MAG: hypothetical protein FWC26_10530 [Fibromonadales bacterium]|nr:hypothetical protein [Fibromonadales bacterium]
MENITEPLEALVPHRGKMLLLSRAISYDASESSLLAEVDILPSSFFYDENMKGVPVWVGFEYMAQAIAALSGKSDLANGQVPGFGFILSVSNFVAEVPSFKVNTTVSVYVKEELAMDNVFLFKCSIKQDGAELAKATLNTIKMEAKDAGVF